MTSILPDDAQGEIPVGFAIVGHIGKKTMRQDRSHELMFTSAS